MHRIVLSGCRNLFLGSFAFIKITLGRRNVHCKVVPGDDFLVLFLGFNYLNLNNFCVYYFLIFPYLCFFNVNGKLTVESNIKCSKIKLNKPNSTKDIEKDFIPAYKNTWIFYLYLKTFMLKKN